MGITRQRERERGEMYLYLLLILLVSPAFGRPSSDQLDVGGDISNQLDDIVEFSKETGNFLNNSRLYGKVLEGLNDAEQNIREMELELKVLQFKIPELQKKESYFPKYNEAKHYLRKTRQELRELAHRTVTDVRALKLLLEDLDHSKKTALLKLAIGRMKDLMIATGKKLEDAKKTYRSANLAFDNLISSVKLQAKAVDKKVSEVYQQFQADKHCVEQARDLCEVLSWFTFGLCSLIHYLVNEVPLSKFREEYEKLQSQTNKIMEGTTSLNAYIEDAINIMTEEIELINIWAKSAERVRKNIDRYPTEYLKKYENVRTSFKNGLDVLKNVAAKFLAEYQ